MKGTDKHGASGAAWASVSLRAMGGVRVQIPADVLRRQRDFVHALEQMRPLATHPHDVRQAARLLQQTTARARGLRLETAERQVRLGLQMEDVLRGPNAPGKVKELIVANDYRRLHWGEATGMVNPPRHVPNNVVDVHVSPDAGRRRDLLYRIRAKAGNHVLREGTQVKTGSPHYVATGAEKTATRPGYGRTISTDARFVNPDGSPRVDPEAFSAR